MPDHPPNILVVISDQLAQAAVGAYGSARALRRTQDASTEPTEPVEGARARTPNIDALAREGVRFDEAYTTCPLSCPARASFWTGRLPHETGVLSNGRDFPVTPVPDSMPTLGSVFSEGGYETIHFGKAHDAGTLRGFEVVKVEPEEVPSPAAFPYNRDTFCDADTTRKCVEYLRRRPAEPFLAVADLVNPHNICGWIGESAERGEGLPVPEPLPPLPANFRDADIEARPVPVQYICCAHRRLMQAARWGEREFRRYLAAYHHYVQLVDRRIGEILDALRSTAAGERTLVVLFSDHGEGMAAHGMVTKHTSFYEETTRVPWVFAGAGVTARGRAGRGRPGRGSAARGKAAGRPLVSLIDLVATLCDMAGLDRPAGLRGASLAPWLRGEGEGSGRGRGRGRDHVVSEWHTEWGYTIEPGRMLRTRRFKYTRYLEGGGAGAGAGGGEELFDLDNDPGETRTLVADPGYAGELARHRELLAEHLEATGDAFLDMEYKADARWRSHAPGHWNHEGPCAPAVHGVR